MDLAVAACNVMDATLGGTEMYRPLQDIFNRCETMLMQSQDEHETVMQAIKILVITDGGVQDPDSVIQLVENNMDQEYEVNLSSLGIGSGVSTVLVEGIAKAGKGTCTLVLEQSKLKGNVISMLRQIDTFNSAFDFHFAFNDIPVEPVNKFEFNNRISNGY